MATDTHIERILAKPAHLSTLEDLQRVAAHPDASEILRRACNREITRALAARRSHESGVRRGGMQDVDPYALKTAREVATETAAEEARKATPRGRFLAALNGVEKANYAQGDRIRAHYNRMLADERKPLDVAAVGTAIVMLNGVDDPSARKAIDALSELLIQTRKAA